MPGRPVQVRSRSTARSRRWNFKQKKFADGEGNIKWPKCARKVCGANTTPASARSERWRLPSTGICGIARRMRSGAIKTDGLLTVNQVVKNRYFAVMQCAACQPHRVVGKYFRRRLNVSDTEFLYVVRDDSFSSVLHIITLYIL